MLKRSIGLIFLIFTTVFGQDDTQILQIRSEYNLIKKMEMDLIKDSTEVEGLSTEGGQIVYFRDQDQVLRIAKVTLYGETGMLTEEYYFTNGELFFIFSAKHTYNAPFYITDQSLAAQGIEPFDPAKTEIREDRFYFHQHRMIRWLNHQKALVTKTSREFIDQEKEILEFLPHIKRNILDYFLALPVDYFKCNSTDFQDSREQRLAVIKHKNIQTGYIRAEFPGYSLELAIFHEGVQLQDILAVVIECGPDCDCNTTEFLKIGQDGQWKRIENILPLEEMDALEKSIQAKSNSQIYRYLKLPEFGTVIKVFDSKTGEQQYELYWLDGKFAVRE